MFIRSTSKRLRHIHFTSPSGQVEVISTTREGRIYLSPTGVPDAVVCMEFDSVVADVDLDTEAGVNAVIEEILDDARLEQAIHEIVMDTIVDSLSIDSEVDGRVLSTVVADVAQDSAIHDASRDSRVDDAGVDSSIDDQSRDMTVDDVDMDQEIC